MGLVSMHDETPDALGRASLLAALDSLAGLIERHMDVDAALRLARSAPELRDVEPFWEGGEDAAFRETPPLGKAPATFLGVPMRRLRIPIPEKRSSPPAILRSPVMSGYPPKARLPAWSPLARRNQPAQGNRPPQRRSTPAFRP